MSDLVFRAEFYLDNKTHESKKYKIIFWFAWSEFYKKRLFFAVLVYGCILHSTFAVSSFSSVPCIILYNFISIRGPTSFSSICPFSSFEYVWCLKHKRFNNSLWFHGFCQVMALPLNKYQWKKPYISPKRNIVIRIWKCQNSFWVFFWYWEQIFQNVCASLTQFRRKIIENQMWKGFAHFFNARDIMP